MFKFLSFWQYIDMGFFTDKGENTFFTKHGLTKQQENKLLELNIDLNSLTENSLRENGDVCIQTGNKHKDIIVNKEGDLLQV